MNQIATLVLNGGNGTFSTPTLTGVSAATTITINSITNSAGGSATPTTGNTTTFSDSSGLMTATITGTSGPSSFRGIHVNALLAGPNLQIVGVVWSPLTQISLHVLDYLGSALTTPFDITNPSTNGGATYQVSSSSSLINDVGQTGTITITNTSPLLTGTFTFTNQDASVVTGSFSCKAP